MYLLHWAGREYYDWPNPNSYKATESPSNSHLMSYRGKGYVSQCIIQNSAFEYITAS